nr:type VI secretion system protein [Ramlibacter albus]
MNFLADNMVIAALLLLTLVALLLLGIVFWAALQNDEETTKKRAAGGTARPQMNLESLKHSFRSAVELIESNLASRSEKYNLSWSLVLNEGDGDTQLPLVQSGIPSALSTDSTLSTSAAGIVWNFFDKGVAVQLQAAYLGGPDEGGDGQKTWDEFLGLCRGYRPERPFDSIVLAVPAQMFMAGDPQSQLELAARAKAIHRRLWLAQNRFALRFPIYLVVSGCEKIGGFSRFAAALPEAMRRGMLGWSSPYEVGAPYQPLWVDLAMDEITRDVSDATAELCALEPAEEDSSDYFMLATDVEKMRGGLKLFMDELMRPSAYHEPFIFRGFYLTGDCSPMSELLGTQAPAQLAAPADIDPTVPALEDEGAAAALPVPVQTIQDLEPAFLRDVFEKKVFPEAGLARASTVQRLRHTGVNRVLRWSAVAIGVVWVCGLGWAVYRLDDTSASIVAALQQLERDSRASVMERGEPVDLDASRMRTLATLGVMERVDAGAFWSVAMPGSWDLFDDIHVRLAKRLESSFSRNSVQPMRLAFYARLNQVTGAPLDASSGQPIVGAGCVWKGAVGASGASRIAINPEDLPEFSAATGYVMQVEELDRAVRAFERLRSTRDGNPQDLKLVVRTLFGVDLPGNAARTSQLFQQHAQNSSPLNTAAMDDAARCAFRQAIRPIHDRLFERNDLLRAEKLVMDRMSTATSDIASTQPAQMLQNWQGVLDAMRDEEALLQPGKGAWIKRRTLQLGQAYETLMQRALAVGLIGRGDVDEMRKQAEDGFGKFLTQWDESQADRRAGPMRGGLKYVDADAKWAFNDERVATRDALATLLAQPFMRPGRGRLPEVPVMATVIWDRARLDQALAYSDSRKKFQAELLTKFPPSMQQSIERMVNAVLAEQVVDTLAQGIVLTERTGGNQLASEDRQRVSRVRVLLNELGARNPSEQLNTVLLRDARARLRALDEAFTQGDVFQPRELRQWTGEKGPLVAAFGTGDPMGLAAYVAQQQAFVESSAKEAEALLAGIEGLDANDPLVQRWRGIVGDVQKYRLKSPASSLQMMEQFILVQSADLDLANCADKLSRVSQRSATDVFGQRLVSLQVRLAARCRELRASEQREGWMKFAEVFNQSLAGRAPFKNGMVTSTDTPPADVQEVGMVMKAYDRAAKAPDRANAAPPLRRFDEQMEKVRTFMAPLFPTDDNSIPGYDVGIEFRANQPGEVEGNKIIEWSVSIGGNSVKMREAAKPMQWQPGTPIVVTMRLARDGPVAPLADPAQPGLWVEDRTVMYRFSDLWSLYSFVASHREPDGPGRSDAKSQLLKFEFPLYSGGEAMKGTPDGRARVFMRVSISPAGKRAPLAWPGSFPTRAPDWTN